MKNEPMGSVCPYSQKKCYRITGHPVMEVSENKAGLLDIASLDSDLQVQTKSKV